MLDSTKRRWVDMDVEDEVGQQTNDDAGGGSSSSAASPPQQIQVRDLRKGKKKVRFPDGDGAVDPPVPFDQDPSLSAEVVDNDPIQNILGKMMQHEQQGTDVTKEFEPAAATATAPEVPSSRGVNDEKLKESVLKRQSQLEEMRHRQRQREIETLNKSTENITKAVEKQKLLATAGDSGEGAESFSSRLRLWRMYSDYKKRLGCPGTGEHVGFNSPPVKLAAQIEVQRQQAQQQRATGSLEMTLDYAVEFLEKAWNRTIGRQVGSIEGLYEEDWKSLKDNDEAVKLALVELDIEFADMFRSRPEFCILFALSTRMVRRLQINRLRRGEVPDVAAPRDAMRSEYADL